MRIFIFVSILLVMELVLVYFFSKRDYENMKNEKKIVWRVLVVLPLLMIALSAYVQTGTIFALLITVSFLLVILSDVLLIFNLMVGMMSFFIYHILNAVNFSIQLPDFSAYAWLHGISAIVGATATFFVFFNRKLKNVPEDKQLIVKVVLLVYTLVLTGSLWRGLMLTIGMQSYLSFAVYAGALLFLVCDLQVAYVNYVSSVTDKNRIINNVIYYGGLSLLAVGSFVM